VLYDETCGFCTALAGWLERRGVGIAPIDSATGAMFLRDLTHEERYASLHAIDASGRRTSGAAALPLILREVPGGRPAAVLCRLMPWPVGAAYRLVARHRVLISRGLGTQLLGSEGEPSDHEAAAASRPLRQVGTETARTRHTIAASVTQGSLAPLRGP
jgi:predicted DCC family thiol-disulfide oxidoreductase YuxK